LACHYADDPVTQAQCTLIATVAFGTIALCPSCPTDAAPPSEEANQRPLTAEGRLDVLDWRNAAHEQTKRAERNLTAAATRTRQPEHNGRPSASSSASPTKPHNNDSRAFLHESDQG